MSEERPEHPQEPAEGGEEEVAPPGAERAGHDRGAPGEARPSGHPEEPAEGSEEDVEAPGAEQAGDSR